MLKEVTVSHTTYISKTCKQNHNAYKLQLSSMPSNIMVLKFRAVNRWLLKYKSATFVLLEFYKEISYLEKMSFRKSLARFVWTLLCLIVEWFAGCNNRGGW